MTGLKENFKNNKGKVLYYVGVFLVLCVKAGFVFVQSSVPNPNEPLGVLIIDISEYTIIAFTIIGPYIFGRDSDLDRVKMERKDLGIENQTLRESNEGYRVTNELQAGVLEENQFKAYRYTNMEKKEPKEPPLD